MLTNVVINFIDYTNFDFWYFLESKRFALYCQLLIE